SMRCRSGFITISSIQARAHARIGQGTAINCSRRLRRSIHRVSGLVQRQIGQPWYTAAVGLNGFMT
ncbi:MAG TPA: hypothetical protein VLI72_07190, partial [Methylibium sp.]|nr:hypothetical protein [Methylibium sp.]